MAQKPPELTDIMNVVAQHFEIPVEELTDMDKRTSQHAQARDTALFVAFEAGYSNPDIAEAMHYKSAGHVSTKFNKIHGRYKTPVNDSDMVLRRDCKAVARDVHVSVPS